MKCPYMLLIYEVTQAKFTTDDNGSVDSSTEVLQQIPSFGECVKRDCAAWQDGRCVRTG